MHDLLTFFSNYPGFEQKNPSRKFREAQKNLFSFFQKTFQINKLTDAQPSFSEGRSPPSPLSLSPHVVTPLP
ncbi:hypothetical protein M413DRAFT_443446 [Hebeloma cylindrosporum]|uniref:Uncharacterized protein n=1 Tax=Hebeloma cylindrosporum TaxID=76867 RepID=A0A0C3C3P5_HEBCY|nr:hypothetical protein M413DRAFT_443446 [Hebeloma cylindrosporum h7]